jgi:hypothetical protein
MWIGQVMKLPELAVAGEIRLQCPTLRNRLQIEALTLHSILSRLGRISRPDYE